MYRNLPSSAKVAIASSAREEKAGKAKLLGLAADVTLQLYALQKPWLLFFHCWDLASSGGTFQSPFSMLESIVTRPAELTDLKVIAEGTIAMAKVRRHGDQSPLVF